jgi:predicted HTH domain antitoxin
MHLDDHFLGQINCKPFSAEELKNIVIQRHRAGNLRVSWKGKKEEEMRSWDFAKMFNQLFTFSRGNVGLSLQAWMAGITNIDDDNRIQINIPVRPELSTLDLIHDKYLIVLVQFILHKRISAEKLTRIMRIPLNETQQILNKMKMAAVIVPFQHGVFVLNPVLHPFIRNKLVELELL